MALGVPANVLGLIVKGDLAGYTIYTDRHGRKIVFPQAPPKDPPSPMQIKQRSRFQTAIDNWKTATPAQRTGFEAITLKLGLCMTGLNLWILISLRGDFALLATLQKQSGITVTDPDFIPWPP